MTFAERPEFGPGGRPLDKVLRAICRREVEQARGLRLRALL
jgi:hypothetical protein